MEGEGLKLIKHNQNPIPLQTQSFLFLVFSLFLVRDQIQPLTTKPSSYSSVSGRIHLNPPNHCHPYLLRDSCQP